MVSGLDTVGQVLARARRRLRLGRALEWGTTAVVPAVPLLLAVLWAWRMESIGDGGALALVAAIVGAVVAAATFAALRPISDAYVASRVDRASGLADRLGTAWDFSHRLESARATEPPETIALMELAIEDGVAATPRADVPAATPFRAPRDVRAAGAFGVTGLAVAMLAFGPVRLPNPFLVALADVERKQEEALAGEAVPTGIHEEDVDYALALLTELRDTARESGDEALMEYADQLEALIAQAERGELSKAQLLEKLDGLDKAYMRGDATDAKAMQEELAKTGRELKKEPVTRKLGEALEKGDLAAAQKEMKELADRMEKGDIPEVDRQKMADAMKKTAEKFEQREKQEQDALDKKIAEKKEERRRLEKEQEKKPDSQEAKRRLEKNRRELDKLERDKQEREESEPRRRLARLHRNMDETAENLRDRNPEKQKQAPQKMRDTADETRQMEQEMSRLQNQKKNQTKMGDLRDALKRARPGKGGGQGKGQQQQRAQRVREWQKRAGGGKGNARQWQPGGDEKAQTGKGQGQGQKGQGQQGQGQEGGEGGDQPGERGDGHGDEDGGDPLGDPTARLGATRDEQLQGAHGAGPSKRETILTGARKGFASESYRRVYVEYKKVIEEVMNADEVPPGYKYHVKRYFQTIRPK